jgi:hypothetical protein
MSPERRFGVTLFVSLALWFPTLQELLANNVTLATGLLRYGVGLGVAWLAVAGVDRLLTGYRETNHARARIVHMRRVTDMLGAIDRDAEGPDSEAHTD